MSRAMAVWQVAFKIRLTMMWGAHLGGRRDEDMLAAGGCRADGTVAGGRAEIIRSTDGGNTWSRPTPNWRLMASAEAASSCVPR